MTTEIFDEQIQTKETIMAHRTEYEKRKTDNAERKRAIKSFTTSLVDFLKE